MVKNLPAMQETWVRSLGQEDPLEGMATHSSILAWRIPMDRGAWWATVHGVTLSQDITRWLSTTSFTGGTLSFLLLKLLLSEPKCTHKGSCDCYSDCEAAGSGQMPTKYRSSNTYLPLKNIPSRVGGACFKSVNTDFPTISTTFTTNLTRIQYLLEIIFLEFW